jgi:hypothetical protein
LPIAAAAAAAMATAAPAGDALTVETNRFAASPVIANSSSGGGQLLLPGDGTKAQVVDSKLAERVQQNIVPEPQEEPADQLISNQELDDMESSITVEPPGVVPSNGSASKSDHLALPEFVKPDGDPGFNVQVKQLFKKIDTDSSGTLDRNEAAKAILFQTGKYMSDKELDQAMKEIDTDGSGDTPFQTMVPSDRHTVRITLFILKYTKFSTFVYDHQAT